MTQFTPLKIYRSVLEAETPINLDTPLLTGKSVRPPVNIPNIVDNLWEWLRPSEFPSRRYSAFASPQKNIAKEHGPQSARVYLVEFVGKHKICQVHGYRNSKQHPETTLLPIFLYKCLGDKWLSGELSQKIEIGRLWIPCLTKSELDFLFNEVAVLARIRNEIRDRIRYWQDVRLIDPTSPIVEDEGELFFQTIDGYFLRPIE